MKELRTAQGGALRVLFSFDPRRQADPVARRRQEGEWNAWYLWVVPMADDLYDDYLTELRAEGLI